MREDFENWAEVNVGQPDFSGYHATLGVWCYNHNIIELCWKCWCAAKTRQHGTRVYQP